MNENLGTGQGNSNECSEDRLMNTVEAASLLGIRPGTLRIWRVHGKGPNYIRLGDTLKAQVRYRRTVVERWIAARGFASTAQETAMQVSQ